MSASHLAPVLVRRRGKKRFSTLVSSDCHAFSKKCAPQLWRGAGIETEDQSLSAHCTRSRTCARSLRVLTPDNGMTLGEDAPSSARPAGEASVRVRFYEAYRCDATMLKMDAVVCSHPVAACEIYLPLDLPIILYVTTRFDLGRLHSEDALRVLLFRSPLRPLFHLQPLPLVDILA